MGYLNVILASLGRGNLNSNFLKNSNALVVAHVLDFKASVSLIYNTTMKI